MRVTDPATSPPPRTRSNSADPVGNLGASVAATDPSNSAAAPLTSGRARHAQRAAIPEHDLVITNYALLRRDLEAWKAVPLRAAILDEAHKFNVPVAVHSVKLEDAKAELKGGMEGFLHVPVRQGELPDAEVLQIVRDRIARDVEAGSFDWTGLVRSA